MTLMALIMMLEIFSNEISVKKFSSLMVFDTEWGGLKENPTD